LASDDARRCTDHNAARTSRGNSRSLAGSKRRYATRHVQPIAGTTLSRLDLAIRIDRPKAVRTVAHRVTKQQRERLTI
jgi:hypothetical protein